MSNWTEYDPETCPDCGHDLNHGRCYRCIRQQNFVIEREDEGLRDFERVVDGKEAL